MSDFIKAGGKILSFLNKRIEPGFILHPKHFFHLKQYMTVFCFMDTQVLNLRRISITSRDSLS